MHQSVRRYLYNTAWRLHTFRMGNGLGSFVYQLQCHGLQPWGLCLVLEFSFLYSWTIFRNRDRRQVWIYSNWPSDPGDYVTPRDLPLVGAGGGGCGVLDSLWFRIFFVLTVCDQNNREELISSIYPFLHLYFRLLSVQKKLCMYSPRNDPYPEMILYMCMQNTCLVMIMWSGPGT